METAVCFLRALAGYRVWDHKHKRDISEELRITDITAAIKCLERKPENESQGSYADINRPWVGGGGRIWGKNGQ
jgi:hypothetical protein